MGVKVDVIFRVQQYNSSEASLGMRIKEPHRRAGPLGHEYISCEENSESIAHVSTAFIAPILNYNCAKLKLESLF